MIISHSRQFIFIKTKKTAGTSLEIALSKILRQGRCSCAAGRLRREGAARCTPACARRIIRSRSGSANFTERVRMMFSRNAVPRFREHLAAADARKLIGREIWDSYLKFTVVPQPVRPDDQPLLLVAEQRQEGCRALWRQ